MAIVTIACETGTGGPEIGLLLASRLRYRYVTRRLIVEHACRLRRLAEARAPSDADVPPAEGLEAAARAWFASIRAALWEFAGDDDVVLIGHGGESVLRGVPHALKVAIVAPFRIRVRRLIERLAAAGGAPPAARVRHIMRVHDADQWGGEHVSEAVDLRELYDVTINRERLSTSSAVDLLSELVGQPELATTEAGLGLVRDRALASKVKLTLAVNAVTRRYRIGVKARHGIVLLESAELDDAVMDAAREIPGVRHVIMRREPVSPPAAHAHGR